MKEFTASKLVFLIIICVLIHVQYISASTLREVHIEPQCYSRFDYEYKVVQKLVQLEEWQKESRETIAEQEKEIKKLFNKTLQLEEADKKIRESKEIIDAQEKEIKILFNKTLQLEEANDEFRDTINKQRETVNAQEKAIKQLQNVDTLPNASGLNIGFTVTNPDKSSSTILIFKTAKYNSLNSYDITTGKFVCQYPGMYLFTATIIRDPGVRQSYCYITLNDVIQTLAYAHDDSTSSSYPSGTATYVTHLEVGDEVYLSSCSGIKQMDGGSCFSGVFIHPGMG